MATSYTTDEQGGYWGANPQTALAEDPAWLAYLRAAGFETAADQADASLQEALLRQGLYGTLEDINRAYDRAGEQLYSSYERRGLGGSGLEARDYSRLQADRGRATSRAQANVEDQVATIYSDLVRRVAARDRQGAETALGLVYGGA